MTKQEEKIILNLLKETVPGDEITKLKEGELIEIIEAGGENIKELLDKRRRDRYTKKMAEFDSMRDDELRINTEDEAWKATIAFCREGKEVFHKALFSVVTLNDGRLMTVWDGFEGSKPMIWIAETHYGLPKEQSVRDQAMAHGWSTAKHR